jgi:hypothetical protein
MPSTNPCTDVRGPWSAAQCIAFLHKTKAPMRLVANGASGFPLVTPLWHIWLDDALWAAAKPSSAIVRALRNDQRCAFEVSIETPPYQGVRGRGHAHIDVNGLNLLQRLLDRYMGAEAPMFQARLLQASQDECAIRIAPTRLTSWDFSKRMAR